MNVAGNSRSSFYSFLFGERLFITMHCGQLCKSKCILDIAYWKAQSEMLLRVRKWRIKSYTLHHSYRFPQMSKDFKDRTDLPPGACRCWSWPGPPPAGAARRRWCSTLRTWQTWPSPDGSDAEKMFLSISFYWKQLEQ